MSANESHPFSPADPNQAPLRLSSIPLQDGTVESLLLDQTRLRSPNVVSPSFQSISLPADAANLLPQAAHLAVEQLQQQAARNPLRALLFNYYAREDYTTEAFHFLVAKIAEAAQMWTDQKNLGRSTPVTPAQLREACDYVLTAQLHFFFRQNLDAINQAGIPWPGNTGDIWLANFHTMMADLRTYHMKRRQALGHNTQRNTSQGKLELWKHPSVESVVPSAPTQPVINHAVEDFASEPAVPAPLKPAVFHQPQRPVTRTMPAPPPPSAQEPSMYQPHPHPAMLLVGYDAYGQPIYRHAAPHAAPAYQPPMQISNEHMRVPAGPFAGGNRGGALPMQERIPGRPTVPSSTHDPVMRSEASIVHPGQHPQHHVAHAPVNGHYPQQQPANMPALSPQQVALAQQLLAGMETASRFALHHYPIPVPGMDNEREQTTAYALDMVLTLANKMRRMMAMTFGPDNRPILDNREMVELLGNGDVMRKHMPIDLDTSPSAQWAQAGQMALVQQMLEAVRHGGVPHQGPPGHVQRMREEVRFEPDTPAGPGRVVPTTEYQALHVPEGLQKGPQPLQPTRAALERVARQNGRRGRGRGEAVRPAGSPRTPPSPPEQVQPTTKLVADGKPGDRIVKIDLPWPTDQLPKQVEPDVELIRRLWPSRLDWPGESAVAALLDQRVSLEFNGSERIYKGDGQWLAQCPQIRENHARVVYALQGRSLPVQHQPIDIMALSLDQLGIGSDMDYSHLTREQLQFLELDVPPVQWHQQSNDEVMLNPASMGDQRITHYTGPDMTHTQESLDDSNAPDWREEIESSVASLEQRIIAEARQTGKTQILSPLSDEIDLLEAHVRSAELMAGFVPLNDQSNMVQTLDPTRPYDYLAFLPEELDPQLPIEDQCAYATPAHRSNWQVTRTAERPFPPAIDRYQKALFHLKTPADEVVEIVLPRNPEMDDYMRHELNPANRQAAAITARVGGPRVVKRWPLANRSMPGTQPSTEAAPTDAAEAVADTAEEAVDIEIVDLNQQVYAHSMSEALARVHGLVTEQGIDRDAPYQGHITLFTPLFGNVDSDKDVNAALDALRAAEGFAQVPALLVEHLDALGPDIVNYIDDKLTRRLNEILQYELSLSGWYIDSFSEDYIDLTGQLETTYGEGLIRSLNELWVHTSSRVLGTLSGKALEDYRARNDCQTPGLVVFGTRIWTTYVPWVMSDLLAENQEFAVVDSDSPEALMLIAQGLDEQLPNPDGELGVSRRVLVDAAGTRYRFFHAGHAIRGNYLVATETPESEL